MLQPASYGQPPANHDPLTSVLSLPVRVQTEEASRQGGYTVRSTGLRFVNASVRTEWTVPHNQIFLDLDGSLTGYARGTVIPYTPFNDFGGASSGCVRAGTTYDSGILCDSSETVRALHGL